MVNYRPRNDLSRDENLGERGPERQTSRETIIRRKEAVYKFSSNDYRSVKMRTSSGAWRQSGADRVINTGRAGEEKGVLRTRKYYQGDERVLTHWIMYEFHMSILDADQQEDFDQRAYVLCIVTHRCEQGDILIGGNNSAPEGLPIPKEAIDTTYRGMLTMVGIVMILLLTVTGSSRSPFSLEKSKIRNTSGHIESCRCLDNVQTSSELSSSIFGDTQTNRATVSPAKAHQVFFNFRGEELRYNFVSHLSDAFERHDIKFFIDKYEQRGKDLNNLFVRIEESSIALAIFSTRYPESSWCMDELVKMHKLVDLGKLSVIPIFYNVEADDVSKPTGDSDFGKNFWRLAEASTGDQIKKWKEALEGITNKMGVSLNDKSVESDSIKDIVEAVQRVIIGIEEEETHFWKKVKKKVPPYDEEQNRKS